MIVDGDLLADPFVLHLFLLELANFIDHLLHPRWMSLRVEVLELRRYLIEHFRQPPISCLIHRLLLVLETTSLREHSQTPRLVIGLFAQGECGPLG